MRLGNFTNYSNEFILSLKKDLLNKAIFLTLKLIFCFRTTELVKAQIFFKKQQYSYFSINAKK